MIRKFIAAFVLIFFAATSTVFAVTINGVSCEDFYAKNELKAGDVIRSEGIGVGPQNWNNQDNFYKTFARQAARMDALRQIVEEVDGVVIEEDRKNPNIIISHISQDGKAFKLFEKNARVIDVKFLDGGGCAVTVECVVPADWKN